MLHMSKPKKPPTAGVRFSEAQEEAIQQALTKRRLRTGKNATKSDAVREGIAVFVQAEGVSWPI